MEDLEEAAFKDARQLAQNEMMIAQTVYFDGRHNRSMD